MKRNINLKIKKYNYFIEQELLYAEKGGIINITELLIRKEKVIDSIYKYKKYEQKNIRAYLNYLFCLKLLYFGTIYFSLWLEL